jgi:hypothetical protein
MSNAQLKYLFILQVVVNASLGQSIDPLYLIRTPSRCHELLRMLLEVLQRSRRAQAVRVQLYGCLLQYMHYCRGSKMASCSPTVLESVLAGISGTGSALGGTPSTAAAARLDANQDAIDRGNAALLTDHVSTRGGCWLLTDHVSTHGRIPRCLHNV